MKQTERHPAKLLLAAAMLGIVPPRSFAASLDDSLFREGLRERGLAEWLDQYLADTPPADATDAMLRERETLLEQAATAKSVDDQRSAAEQASRILRDLLAKHPEHPSRLRWQFELARDLLERTEPGVFDALLLYEVPGRNREQALVLSERAVEVLNRLREDIAAAWKSVEALDEASLKNAMASGSLRLLETLDGRSAYLQASADFCRVLGAGLAPAEQKKQMQSILARVAQGSGWIQSPDPVQRCGALLMAAVAARLAGEYVQADQYSLQIVKTYGQIGDARDRALVRTASLVAVIEQIRTLRDRNRHDDALSYVEQIRAWAEKSRPNDLQASLAIAWAHHTVLARRAGVTTQPASLLRPEDTLQPLESFAKPSPENRDALYAVVAGAVKDDRAGELRTPFGLQLLLGATVAELSLPVSTQPVASQPVGNRRLEDLISAARGMLGTLPADVVPETRGEYLYLLGAAHIMAGRPLEAVTLLCDLGEQQPMHDRSSRAVAWAVVIAEGMLRETRQADPRAVRDAFIRAGRLMRTLSPDSPAAKALSYYIAAALEQNGELQAAAETYATVAPDDARSLVARVGEARCLSTALDQAVARKSLNQTQLQQLADRAIGSARKAAAVAQEKKDDTIEHRRLAAETVILLATVLNHSMIDKSPESLTLLEEFEKRFADQPSMLGVVWRERVVALTRLGRLAEARQAAERCLATDPEEAGPVLDQLSEAMRAALDRALDAGDPDTAGRIARDAMRIGTLLSEWSGQRPHRVSVVGRLSIRLRLASSMLHAGQAKEALAVYEECGRTAATMPSDTVPRAEIQLGRAECLLATGDPATALPLFAEVWQRLPERSPNWWRALSGSLTCHTRLDHDPKQILEAIQQQRGLSPDLGGPRWQRALETLQKENEARLR
jgi:tetratricopeptide (TPR) repeat protein